MRSRELGRYKPTRAGSAVVDLRELAEAGQGLLLLPERAGAATEAEAS